MSGLSLKYACKVWNP